MDGSNQFGSNPKYRFLPIWSVSGKYTLSNEKFMQKQNIITYLALRASYGIQGNVDGGTSPDLVLRLGAKNSVTGQNISNIAYLPNPDLRWEKTRSYNLGLDLSLLDNRISFVIDTYSKRGTDMIMTKNVSQTNGYQSLKINAGKVNNKGIEIGANFIPFKTRDWDITVGVNYSYNKNKLIDANESLNTTDEKLSGNALVVGEALGTLYSYDFVGLNHESGYPVFRAKDGTTTFTNSAGNEYPNYVMYQDDVNLVKSGVLVAPNQGGINLSVGYKGLRLSGSFTYQFGGVGRLASLYEYSSSTFDPMSNVSKDYAKRWRQPGDEEHTNIPVLFNRRVFSSLFNKDYISGQTYLYPTSLYDSSTARVAKTDFLKLRSLTLNYVVPKKFLSRFNLTQLMIGLQATNLFTWADSRWEGSDPEAAYATTPLSRAYSLNVNLTF
jgi:outer membrane receptor protein involved in Fe transport